MPSAVPTARESRTLLIDASIEHGGRLVEQLNHAGFRTDSALTWHAACAALGANYYHSCIVVADLDEPAELDELDRLRRAAPRVWIIVLGDRQFEQAIDLGESHGVDALLSAPFSMLDLTSRLAAFALRARSTC